MLCNALGMNTVLFDGPPVYSDVTYDKWYYSAVTAARRLGLLNGIIFDNMFKPNDPITRLEAADVLSKLAVSRRITPINNFRASYFSDFDEIYPSSMRAVELAVNAGFLNENGMGNGKFEPFGFITRAQVATIQITTVQVLRRFY